MINLYRAASFAAVTLCTAFGVATAAPSAETVHTAVSATTNEQPNPPVPAIVEDPAIDASVKSNESASEAAPAAAAPVATPRAANLAQLVALQAMPQTLDRDAECLAASVYFESKGEPLEGQLAVAEVVINRAESGGRFPPSICKVVFQKGQFHFVRGGGFPPIAKNSRAWREAVAIAQIAMNEAWESRASNAMFFHATRVWPRWNKTRVATLGNHVFYR